MRGKAPAVLIRLGWLALAAPFVLPFYWAFVASLRPPGLPPAASVEWWPAHPYWANYAELFRVVPMGRFALNSFFVVAVAVPATLLIAALAGFALSQLPNPWRRRLVTLNVALLLVPGMAVWTFRTHVLAALGLIDTLWALIVPALAGGSPLLVLLFYWGFRRVSPELYESARLDGAEAWAVWRRVALPLARPTTAAAALLAFALYWGDFTTPVLYIYRPQLYTLPIGLQLLNQMDNTNLPLLMAGATLMTLPVVILFLAIQFFFLRDLSVGRIED